MPDEDKRLLHPNGLVSRRFYNSKTGRSITLLIIQTEDARALEGHYPPICYYNRGWTQLGSRSRHWMLGDVNAPGMEYDFHFSSFDASKSWVVADMMILPTGQIKPDMSAVYAAASDLKNRYYGAAQFEIVFYALPTYLLPSGHEIVQTFLDAHRKLIDAIRMSPAWERAQLAAKTGAVGSSSSSIGGIE